MSKSILVLTPHPDHPSARGRWPYVLEDFREALGTTDVDVFDQPWNEPVTQPYDLIVPLIAFGYHNASDDFKTALAKIAAKGHRMLNPAPIIAWNIDKRYLKDLADAGVRIVPTVFVDRLDEAALDAARADFGTSALVVKPIISGGARNTVALDAGLEAPLKDGATVTAPEGEAMIQPFMSSIQTEGEWSLLYYGGVFSHAVLKTPKAGDFRSQPDYDAHLRSLGPPPEALELAEAALGFVGLDQLLYARVDMVRDDQGRFCLMELELIEPDIYLKYDDQAPDRLAHAFEHALGLACGHHH